MWLALSLLERGSPGFLLLNMASSLSLLTNCMVLVAVCFASHILELEASPSASLQDSYALGLGVYWERVEKSRLHLFLCLYLCLCL
jgi:hypothetical protein